MELKEITTQDKMDSIKDWTKITYKGLNLFDEYNKICETLLGKINEDEDLLDFCNEEKLDGQEVYLGWFPNVDSDIVGEYFISGWDLFTDEGGKSCVIEIYLDSQGFHFHEITDCDNKLFYDGLYNIWAYSENNIIKKHIKTIIDIKLD